MFAAITATMVIIMIIIVIIMLRPWVGTAAGVATWRRDPPIMLAA